LRGAILAFAILSILLTGNQALAQEQIVLEAPSDQGTLTVEITWTPDDIGSGHSFDIRFIEPGTGEEIEEVIYDFSIYNDGSREVLRRGQSATQQEFTFDEQGSYTIRIDNIDGLDENVSIPIEVTPEFPLGALVLIAIAISATVLVARRNSNNLFRQLPK
jgi:hypothetical protein